MLNIFHVHGFNSGPDSSTGKLIKREFPEANVKSLGYDSSKRFEENFASLISQIGEIDEETDIIIGNSLGGYYAAGLSAHFICYGVLINPCIYPHKYLSKWIGENVSMEDGHKWVLTQEIVNSYKIINEIMGQQIPRLVLIGKNDEVLDPQENLIFWKGKAQTIVTNDNHKFKTLLPYKRQIEEIPYFPPFCMLNDD